MTTAARTRYLDREPGPAGESRLFCFHHAGGGASVFTGWPDALAPAVAVYPVQLPGREGRVAEPRIRELAVLVDELNDQLDFALTGQFAFYGHSMGALVAYALTQRRLALGRSLPAVLAVGAFPGPLLRAPLADVPDLSDERLADLLVAVGGMSETVRRYPAWTAAAITLLRDDLVLCHGSRPPGPDPLPVPIRAFTGAGDPLMSRADAAAWAAHTTAGFQLDVVPGGHLFLRESPDRLLASLAATLAG